MKDMQAIDKVKNSGISDNYVSLMADYKKRMEEEGLVHRKQDYKNMMLTIGDTWRYLPGVLAWTNAETQITILPHERMPYKQSWEFVLKHEKEHCIDPGASEPLTDRNAADPFRDYRRRDIRVMY